MKKIISISIITCLLLFSCETSKQENKLSETSQVELASPASQEDTELQSQDNTQENQTDDNAETNTEQTEETLESEQAESETEESETEKISEEDPSENEINEELISSEEIENDLSEKKAEEKNQNNDSAVKTENTQKTPEITQQKSLNKQNTPEVTQQKTLENQNTPEVTQQKPLDNKKAPESSQTKTTTPSKKSEISIPEQTEQPEQPEQKTLQQELSEASDQIKEEAVPVPSRSMQIKNHQFIDVAYPGTGWIYLGEVEKQNLFVFFGRKIENGETVFTLQPKKSGDATLHFYKNDPLSQKYIDDFMTVSVSSESATDTLHQKAPRYASIVPPKPEKIVNHSDSTAVQEEIVQDKTDSAKHGKTEVSETATADSQKDDPENIQTRISKDDGNVEKVPDFSSKQKNNTPQEETPVTDQSLKSSSDLLTAAQKAYDEKKYAEALSLVRDFFLASSNRIDEGLFLEAQILEAKSPVQNIKGSITDYDTIVNKWPASKFWKKANERSIYLKRFYIDIR